MKHLVFLLGCVPILACGDKLDAVVPRSGPCPAVPVTYERDVRQILEALCTGCHAEDLSGSARKGAPTAVNLDSFAAAAAHADRSNIRLQNNSMPPGGTGASAEQRDVFDCWLRGGAQEKP